MTGKATSDRRKTSKAVKGIPRLDDVLPIALSRKELSTQSVREDIILYQDTKIVQQMCAEVIAARHKQGFVWSILGKVQGILDKAAISLEDLDEYDVNEFTIKPVLKAAIGIEAGAEFEVKWTLRDEVDIFKALTVLFSKLRVESVSQLLWHVEKQDCNTSISDLVYAGKPVCIYGIEDSQRSTDEEFHLRDGEYTVSILLNQEFSKLQAQLYFLQDRRIYLLGLIDCVQPLRVQAGALLLSNRTVLSMQKMA